MEAVMTEATPGHKPPTFDPTVPNVARMYDYYLGGKNNFAADREAGDKALAVAPELRVGAAENRKFLNRTVRFLVDAGIRQFIDIGCGLPTQGSVHEIAQAVAPETKVAYVDNDPVVAAHARAILEHNPLTTVIQGDIREPDGVLADATLSQLINLDKPVGILLIAVLHVLPDDELVLRIVKALRDAIAPGSYLAISHAVSDLRPEVTAKLAALYRDVVSSSGAQRSNLRTMAEVRPYFDGLDLVEPGLVYVPQWRPDPAAPPASDLPVWAVGGVARKN
jgi:SAM-dependent methyltransferase